MKLIYQPTFVGCFAACCATLFGGEYDDWDCVGHHHEDWREKLREKTGLDYFEVGVAPGVRFSVNDGDIYILGVKLPFGGKHVVLATSVNAVVGQQCQFDIFHDPLGPVRDAYEVEAVIVLSKIFRMP